MAATARAFDLPLKCTPEESKHFVEPALAEAEQSNYVEALDIVSTGLNAHPASEGLLFLRAYLDYKLADAMSNQLSSLPKAIQSLGAGLLLVDGGATTTLLGRFQEIIRVLGDADNAVEELLQVNPQNEEVTAFKGYIDGKLQKLAQESENLGTTFNNSPHIAGGFCVGCKKSISFDSQTVVFRRATASQLEVWHLPCFQKLGPQVSQPS
ncbi:hypothetical protein E6H36_10715 [Candidatus Bathyarchaeota archaeon]|nr:MAG: hypothetical protein AUJ07_01115 [Crenarchaeota archaeon 13_1_40CM_3_53_5]TMI23408.1 MAG: hypothetical protein E6H36_10715 [Candidatus Bathyarchaeota archaeon]TMI32190.1 MAG: hypothetical protein E6H29_02795 [Candidatus Bathyarchaeota archaeon]